MAYDYYDFFSEEQEQKKRSRSEEKKKKSERKAKRKKLRQSYVFRRAYGSYDEDSLQWEGKLVKKRPKERIKEYIGRRNDPYRVEKRTRRRARRAAFVDRALWVVAGVETERYKAVRKKRSGKKND